jgi:hypothetical protein
VRSPDTAAEPRSRTRDARLRLRCAWRALAAALVVVAGLSGIAPAASGVAQLPSRSQVRASVAALKSDPDLKTTQQMRILRWKASDTPEEENKKADAAWLLRLLDWLTNAGAYVAEAGRWLMWLLGALLVALIAVSARRWLAVRTDGGPLTRAILPSRVGALDVRPESLPQHIGAEARKLWLQGLQRPALSLLYRGALSRLIHVHAVPIRAAHTESECLRLTQASIESARSVFFARLVATWQLAVYGARVPESASVLQLCDEFDRYLDPPAAPAHSA